MLLDPIPRASFANQNPTKNRFEDAMPFDHCRVVLPIRVKCTGDSSYTNASQIQVTNMFTLLKLLRVLDFHFLSNVTVFEKVFGNDVFSSYQTSSAILSNLL